MNIITILLVLIAILIAFFLVYFQYFYKNRNVSQLSYWLSFFRFIAIFSILLLFINPSLNKKNIEIIKPNLVIAVDNSSSINYNSQSDNVTAILKLLKNNTALNNKFSVNYYSFGNQLSILDSLNFKEPQTNLSLPFTEFNTIYRNQQYPIVIITDGNQTIGNSLEFINFKNPVFPVIVGDTTKTEDIYIQQLNTNKYTIKDNQFPVEVFINYVGSKSVNKKISVWHNEKIVFSKELSFFPLENSQNISFFLNAEKKGVQFYTVKIEALENEQNTLNNSKNFSIEVIEEASKILIITSINHPDLGMLKNAIETNKQQKATIFEIDNFNSQITDYNLVILYQPNYKFKSIFNKINNQNLNFLVISGLSTDWDFLNENQSLFHKNKIFEVENYQASFNKNFSTFMTDDIGFSTFPPLEDNFGTIEFSTKFETLLYQKIGTIETETPLLAIFDTGKQKGGILLGENSWKWRMSSFQSKQTFEYFDLFISNLLQYLASDFTKNRLSVNLNSIYFTNETINISANYLDANFNVASKAKLWLTITNKNNTYFNKVPLTFVENHFEVELSNIPPNEYVGEVTVENSSEKLNFEFKILPFEVEQQFTQANATILNKLAVKTNGTIFYNNQASLLVEQLNTDNRFKSIQKTTTIRTSLINWKWLLVLVILSLSIEWFVRKYFGKI